MELSLFRKKILLITWGILAFILLLWVASHSASWSPRKDRGLLRTTTIPALFSQNKPYNTEKFCSDRRWSTYKQRISPRKIYDLFLINDELDWLEIRLGEMFYFVDFFVIIKSDITFQNHKKPLLVKENWNRFKPWHSKMILRTLNSTGVKFGNTWEFERFSRNALYDQVIPFLGHKQAASLGDVILVSDIDEIIRPEALLAFRYCDFPERVTLRSISSYYSYQWASRNHWDHPQATYYKGKETVLPHDLRTKGGAVLQNGGWRCTYCFKTIAQIVSKISSSSHTELNLPKFKDPQQILYRVRNGIDLYNRNETLLDRLENNKDIPEFIQMNTHIYSFVLNRDPVNANFKDIIV